MNTEEQKARHRVACQRYRARHPERVKAWYQTYKLHQTEEQKERCRANTRRYRAKHPEKHKIYYQAHKEQTFQREHRRREELKYEVFAYYSGGVPRCGICGETDVVVLCIDHIDGGGAEHKRVLGGSAYLYPWLKKNNFPSGFQVLCANCNVRKAKLELLGRHDG